MNDYYTASSSTYNFKRHFFRHGRRTAPKFGTHVRIDTLTLKKIDPPHKGGGYPLPGFRGLSIVKNLSRWTAPKFGTHVRIDTVTLTKIDPPHPRGFRGLSIDFCGLLDVCGFGGWCLWDVCGFLSTRPSDRAQIWHACADRYAHLKKS